MAKIDTAPKKGDRNDLRCAFVQHGCTTFEPMTDMQWCAGCGFFVCDKCDDHPDEPAWGEHDVSEHVGPFDEDVDGDDDEDDW